MQSCKNQSTANDLIDCRTTFSRNYFHYVYQCPTLLWRNFHLVFTMLLWFIEVCGYLFVHSHCKTSILLFFSHFVTSAHLLVCFGSLFRCMIHFQPSFSCQTASHSTSGYSGIQRRSWSMTARCRDPAALKQTQINILDCLVFVLI